ncbi:MAG: hypothetical protein K0V04_23385 [Deltaproteobacteria bacterium]|nr:hypothetical protein [Deltaproteobacteria bacterium]
MLLAALIVAQLAMPDGVDELSLTLTQPMTITLDPSTYDEDSSIVRSEPVVLPGGITVEIQVGTGRLEPLDLYAEPVTLYFDEAFLWEGNTLTDPEVIDASAQALAAHLRRPDMDVMCADRQLQTFVPSSLGGPIAIAVALSGGQFGSLPSGDDVCMIEIVDHGGGTWTTKCEPHACDLGGGEKGHCGPTVLSQCMCARGVEVDEGWGDGLFPEDWLWPWPWPEPIWPDPGWPDPWWPEFPPPDFPPPDFPPFPPPELPPSG